MPESSRAKKNFRHISGGGIFFQGGAAAIDTTTIVATLVHGLTGSALAVGMAAAIQRYGWLFPQIFVAYLAQSRVRRMGFYKLGAFGRAGCLAALATLLAAAGALPHGLLVGLFFVLWIAYSFIGGIVAVPYNDIVGRSIPSERRSRMLAIRFFGGGILALAVAAAAHYFLNLEGLPFPTGYAVIVALGAVLMLVSCLSFIATDESDATLPARPSRGFVDFLAGGVAVFRGDERFRLFIYAQWLGGAVTMAFPFYILQATALTGGVADVAFLLGASTAGALASNALWGWWGDRHGKRSLFEGVTLLRIAPPVLILVLTAPGGLGGLPALPGLALVFMLMGALGNGITIAMLGYLMEISPDDRRPAYSGYFNAMVAPASLLPLAGAVIVEAASLRMVFVVSLIAAMLQFLAVRRLRRLAP
jgi:MFS family permease